MDNTVKILGARGSMACSGPAFERYGGRTTCVLVRMGGQTLILDAGTGIMALPAELGAGEKHLTLLLTHPHADHLLGFPLCSALFDSSVSADIYAATRDGLDTKAQITRLMSPPLWPITPEAMNAKLTFRALGKTLTLGSVTVDTMEGVHPGGVTLLRIHGEGKSVVFISDCTLTDGLLPAVKEFARNCDLLLCDGQYSDEEWAQRAGFGHSRWTDAARLGTACGAKSVRITHHDPNHTDETLERAQDEIRSICPVSAFAYDGEEISL